MVAQLISPQIVGFRPSNPQNGTTTFQNNAAANWLAFSFVAETTTTLSGFRNFAQTATSVVAGDQVATLWSDVNGLPGASLTGTSNTLSPAASTGTWNIWTSFSGTLTITTGTRYWIVVTNANATPASHNITFRFGTSGTTDGVAATNGSNWGFSTLASSNSGTSWVAASATSSCGYRVDFADGTFLGLPASQVVVAGTSQAIFGANYAGIQFVAPTNFPVNVRGASLNIQKSGSPTGALSYALYNGTTLIDTTATMPVGNVASGTWNRLLFPSTHPLVPGATYNLVAINANADSSGNSFRNVNYTIDSDSNSLALVEWGARTVTSTNSGGAFSTVANTVSPWALFLDTNGEFQAAGFTRIVGGGLAI